MEEVMKEHLGAEMRDRRYKKLQSQVMELAREVESFEKSERLETNKKRLRAALRHIDLAFNNITIVRG
jgi:hypothetical protein